MPPGEPYLLVGESRPAVGLPLPVRENAAVTLTCVSERSLPPAELSWLVGSAERNVTAQSRRTVTPLRAAAGSQLFTTRSHVTLNMTRDLAGQRITCVTSHRHWRVRQRTSVQLDVQCEYRQQAWSAEMTGRDCWRPARRDCQTCADTGVWNSH